MIYLLAFFFSSVRGTEIHTIRQRSSHLSVGLLLLEDLIMSKVLVCICCQFKEIELISRLSEAHMQQILIGQDREELIHDLLGVVFLQLKHKCYDEVL